jgi:hypothetical protein
VVGDLAALDALLEPSRARSPASGEAEGAARAAAKAEAQTAREALVSQAEAIAAVPVERIQWKTASADDAQPARHLEGAPALRAFRLDKDVEAASVARFSKARNSFDKARRSHFAELESTRAGARATKEKLVAEAERSPRAPTGRPLPARSSG